MHWALFYENFSSSAVYRRCVCVNRSGVIRSLVVVTFRVISLWNNWFFVPHNWFQIYLSARFCSCDWGFDKAYVRGKSFAFRLSHFGTSIAVSSLQTVFRNEFSSVLGLHRNKDVSFLTQENRMMRRASVVAVALIFRFFGWYCGWNISDSDRWSDYVFVTSRTVLVHVIKRLSWQTN